MTKRTWPHGAYRIVILAALATMALPGAALAQIHQVRRSDSKQGIDFTIGYFALKGLDSRVNGDVLLNDLQVAEPLLFDVKDFNNAIIGGDWLVSIGRNLEASIGLGYYQRTVPSVYANLQNPDQSEIAQDLKLRTVPVTFTARLLPLGRGNAIEPYLGAGVTAIRWRYSEIGEFVELLVPGASCDVGGDNCRTFNARFVADGTAIGPVFIGGLRVPVGDVFSIGGELRYQKVEGNTGGITNGFLGDKIDLGGWTGNFVLHMRF
jgi:opacity protein-like surface antigen